MNDKKKKLIIDLIKKMPSLMFGLLLYSIGILLTLYSKLGMSPWDVFHMGIVQHSSLTLGQVSELTGFVILLISYFLGVIPGLASVLNMIFIGLFIDLIEKFKVFSTPDNIIGQMFMLFMGIFVIGWATYFYLRVGLGAGPRDGLMEGLVKKINKPVWMIRGAIEGTVLIIGYILGGPVGIGTLITAGSIGFSVQFAFKIGKYSSKDTDHMNLILLYKDLRQDEIDINDTDDKLIDERNKIEV
ncbi:membrane protein [Clostridium sp. CX1]|uniref:YczE/YyaS/YitT family protein n=1 Tax=Clostridium sp. CX1 TaxID=2978346 RepID=UPI0021BF3A11|nr:membrane protein [Clostridium sp. CX1]MCT8976439.1 membrane protein [Clostridium sp. CX1]